MDNTDYLAVCYKYWESSEHFVLKAEVQSITHFGCSGFFQDLPTLNKAGNLSIPVPISLTLFDRIGFTKVF